MNKQVTLLLSALLLLATGTVFGQNAIIRGTILDPSGEPVVGATVSIPALGKGGYTNEEGVYSLSKLPAGKHTMRVVYLGMDTLYKSVEVSANQTVTVPLKMRETDIRMAEVEITDKTTGKIEKTEITVGLEEITTKDIKIIPSFGGAPDLAQFLQVMPGVLTTGDQGGQLYIRGGTPIQNLVLLDGAVIYSPFHSIGLFSVFDADYIRSADVYSASFPAQFGGRVSSVMDIRARNGDYENYHAKIDVNPVMAGTLIEGPIFKAAGDKNGGGSFLLSARRCYLDQSSMMLYRYINDTVGLPYNFSDIFLKTSFSDGANSVNVFGFYQGDNVNYEYPTNYKWNSVGGGLKFMVLPSASNLVLSGNFAYSIFNSGLQTASEDFPRKSLIGGFNGGLNFSYILNNVNEINYGISLLGFRTDFSFTNSFGLITSQNTNNTEAAGYVRYKKVFYAHHSDPEKQFERMVIEPGVRLHYYNDHSFVSAEPRIRAKLNFPGVSFTGGTGLYSQNLISATSDRDVVNLFQGFLSSPLTIPGQFKSHALQTGIHALAGVELELLPNLSTTVEGWYKNFTQLTNINRDKLFPEDPDFIMEKGEAKGVDLILKYETPKNYVYLTYGLARVQRDNGSQVYPTLWDRRHNINAVAARSWGTLYRDDKDVKGKLKFSDSKWEVSTRFSLGSGFPFTQTQGFFEKVDFFQGGSQTNYVTQNGNLGILYAQEINGGRLPYYHRWDISAKRRWVIRNFVLIEGQVSVLNVYNRANIFYFDRVRFAVVNQLPILPSIGFSAKF